MKFEKGQLLVYGVRGVCRVEDIRTEAFGSEEREYCILQPLDDPKATIYLPTDSDRIEKNVKRVITAEEIDRLIGSIPTENDKWIDDNKQRSELFKRILDDGDRLNLVRLIKSIHIHRDEIEKNGKKLGVADKNVLERAERIIYDEFAMVLGINSDDVGQFIKDRVAGKACV